MIVKSSDIEEDQEATVKDVKKNRSEQLIQFKIVYWGPGESGKTTNFFRLREKFGLTKISKGFSIETTDGRTLWQDSLFLSFDFSFDGREYKIIVQIVTCTGQERFLSTREYVLDGADGIVFVGDSEPEKIEQNKRSFRELISFADKNQVPFVIQLNKRDLDNAVKMADFKKQLGLPPDVHYPDGNLVVYPTNAIKGDNIVPCFEDLMVEVIFGYFKQQIS